MKIGTRFPECVADIITGKVDIANVLLILDYGGYNFESSEDWDECWEYHARSPHSPWHGFTQDDVWYVIDDLVFSRKIHRYENNIEPAWRFTWMDLIIPNEHLDEIPQLRQLWEEYELLAKLSTPPDKY